MVFIDVAFPVTQVGAGNVGQAVEDGVQVEDDGIAQAVRHGHFAGRVVDADAQRVEHPVDAGAVGDELGHHEVVVVDIHAVGFELGLEVGADELLGLVQGLAGETGETGAPIPVQGIQIAVLIADEHRQVGQRGDVDPHIDDGAVRVERRVAIGRGGA